MTTVVGVAAAVSAVGAALYCYFTYKMIKEVRKDSRLRHKPFLEASLHGAKFPDEMTFWMKSVGGGPALIKQLSVDSNTDMKWSSPARSLVPVDCNEKVSIKAAVEDPYVPMPSEVHFRAEYGDIFAESHEIGLTYETEKILDNRY